MYCIVLGSHRRLHSNGISGRRSGGLRARFFLLGGLVVKLLLVPFCWSAAARRDSDNMGGGGFAIAGDVGVAVVSSSSSLLFRPRPIICWYRCTTWSVAKPRC